MKTTDSFSLMTTGSGLPHRALEALHGDGFAVIRGPIATRELQRFAESYDKVVLEADPSDTKHGSTTTRVDDLVNRGAEFDCIYVHPPLLEACCHVFMQPFKLSTMFARTFRPGRRRRNCTRTFLAMKQGGPWSGSSS